MLKKRILYLNSLGIPYSKIALYCYCDPNTLRRWVTEKQNISDKTQTLIELGFQKFWNEIKTQMED